MALTWALLLTVIIAPVIAAAFSPLLAWRQPVYILAGFAGVIGLALMTLQPMLIAGYLPGIPAFTARRIHRRIGAALVLAVVIHIAGLWVTSPPDVIDVLLFSSPTPFSLWGVIAMWGIFATALLAIMRKRLRLRPVIWRRSHIALALVITFGTIAHAMLIEGTMETISKAALCLLLLIATLKITTALRR